MNKSYPSIYGIGNPLIDIVISVSDKNLKDLELNKGVMHLVNEHRQKEIYKYFKGFNPRYFPGGSAPNTILACSGLGIQSIITGKIGNDAFGDIYLKQVAEYGVISELIQGEGTTGSSIILVTPDGERTMNTHLGMCQEFSVDDINESILSKVSYLYFTGYMWDTESQKLAIKKAIQLSKHYKIKIVFDLADPFVVERNKEEFLTMINNDIDILFANESEISLLLGSDNIEVIINKLVLIIEKAGIKIGKKGSIVIDNGKIQRINPNLVQVIDTTGAGDMYAAGFLSGLVKDLSSKKSGEIGSMLAEEIIQQFGAQFTLGMMNDLKSKFYNL